ncbi:tol-pal system protein YbgF [Vibrio algarum]|uniref:Cell division coordinator CpoB n=1 Tax=Vibrio algarum TaxID=3020714 RepID=A0ABT4YSE0_9VIBR|nr:tol-pal system protein YbgF [Vibrio sp. KJ40-1]MDB1124305.1 tol-pal system protein YbgF [Vibrio sp. KJ40-1]
MFSNFKRAVSLALLASAANLAFAAPAPVSDLNSTSSSATSKPETDVQRLERLLNNRSRVQLQMQQQIDGMESELSELRGMVERNSYDMKQMLERQRELFIELDRLRNEKQQPIDNVAPATNGNTEIKGGVYAADANEEAAYKKAVYLVQVDKDYTGALAAFAKFQKDFPNSSYSANSHYWVGQLNYALKKDVDAAKSFASVVSYEKSNKRADSLVKLGDIAARNGKPAVANKYYQQAIDEYPGSASAKMAKSKLK